MSGGDAPLRVVVAGCGGHARNTVYPAMLAAGYELVACCARHGDRAEQVRARFGVAHAYEGIDEMLRHHRARVDAAVLVLPPDGYEEAVLACLDAGLPVYCEKPAALSTAPLRRMEERAAAAGLAVMVGYMKRFAPAYERALRLASDAGFGGVRAYQARWAMGPGFPTLEHLLTENATHHLDLARFVCGEVVDLQAWHSQQERTIVVGVLARFSGGAVATLELSTAHAWDHVNETVTITGTGSAILVDNVDTVMLRAAGQPELRWRPNYTVPLPRTSSLLVTGFVPALQHFARTVRDGEPCRSDVASARRTMELAEAILAAIG